MDIQRIADAIRGGRVRVTDHADEEAQADRLSLDEVFGSVWRGEVIEDYPSDRHLKSWGEGSHRGGRIRLGAAGQRASASRTLVKSMSLASRSSCSACLKTT